MTEQEILDGNRLIAGFMQVKPTPDCWNKGKYCWSDMPWISISNETEEKTMNSIVKYVKYHSKWDWLMPVVDQIEQRSMGIYQVDITQEGCQIKNRCRYYIDRAVSKVPIGTTKLEAVWMAVVQFLNDIHNGTTNK